MRRESLYFLPAAGIALYAGIILTGTVIHVYQQSQANTYVESQSETYQGLQAAGSAILTGLGGAYATRRSKSFVATAQTWNFNREAASLIKDEQTAS